MAAESPGWQTLLGMGAAIAAALAIGTALGWFIDSQLNTVPIFTIVGLAAGIVMAVAYTVVTFRKYLKT